MAGAIRTPNWDVHNGQLTIYCDGCGRWLCCTTAIREGEEFLHACKKCGRHRFVTPAAAVHQLREAA
jgi:flavoprotein